LDHIGKPDQNAFIHTTVYNEEKKALVIGTIFWCFSIFLLIHWQRCRRWQNLLCRWSTYQENLSEKLIQTTIKN